jgi:predicted ArsR family transcriptional regulator
MHARTRELLGLLAKESTDQILDALGRGPTTEADLAAVIGASQQTVNRRLNELRMYAIVENVLLGVTGPKVRGQPARTWRLSSPSVLRFCDSGDALTLELLDALTDELRQDIESRRRQRIQEAKGS